MVSACFGGIANGINLASSFANHRSGARGPLSVVVTSGVMLAGLFVLPPLIALLPRVVIAGVLTTVAIQLVDRRTLFLLRSLFLPRARFSRAMAVDLTVIACTAAIAISVNIVFAVAFGMAVTVLFFLLRMSQSAIRREYRGGGVRSRKSREVHHLDILAREGRRILVLELEGPLFFGSAEKLAQRIDAALDDAIDFVIVDIRRVNDIDSTGARILVETHDRLTRRGRHLLLAGLSARPELAVFLRDVGVTAAVTHGKLFDDTDRALEWAEDRVILGELGAIDAGAEFPFGALAIFAGMSESDLAVVTARLQRRIFKRGEFVFREGAPGREMFIIAKGTASVHLRLPGTGRSTRLITFSPGTVFGELALLDRGARSASVEADGFLVCHALPQAEFDLIARNHPAVAIRLLGNLDRELATRLRLANRTIHLLAG
jgi:anti-anti-sigma factor